MQANNSGTTVQNHQTWNNTTWKKLLAFDKHLTANQVNLLQRTKIKKRTKDKKPISTKDLYESYSINVVANESFHNAMSNEAKSVIIVLANEGTVTHKIWQHDTNTKTNYEQHANNAF